LTFDAFLETAWNDHADRPQEVADRLAASLHLVQTPEHIPPFMHLSTHVFGEHLGQWQRGIDLLESLRSLSAFDGSRAVAGALIRNVAALRYAGGDRSAMDPLGLEDRVSALATAASAFTGRNAFAQAIAAYSEALRLANPGLPPKSPALRALAIGGNNLAAALETKNDRDATETLGMIAAAEGGLTYWKQAGTWLEEERAEYRLTRSLLQAGEPLAAIHSAERCIEICKRNNAPAFEQFFGYAGLALAQRAAGSESSFEAARLHALQLLERVPHEDRTWCASDLAELAG
jgi:tetratricopeptide (TPR) repeat protein